MFAKVLRIAAMMALIVILTACGAQATPVVPTPDNAATLSSVSTQAAGTVVAGLTQNAPVATNTTVPTETSVPTNTTEPTATVVLPPTNTPVPPTATFAPIVATYTPAATATTASKYSCTISEASPSSGQDFKRDEEFDARWKIKNTGSEDWNPNETDIRFDGGTRFHEGSDVYDLSEEVDEGESYDIVIDMRAPGDKGNFTGTWIVVGEHGVYCTMTVNIDVVD